MSPQLILLFVCLVLGILLRRTGKFPANTPHVLNAFIIWVSFPALVLFQIPKLLDRTVWSMEILIPVSMPWIHFILALLLLNWAARRLRWGRLETGALVLTAGLGNTSFVGLPLLESVLGTEAIPIGVLVDQPGSFLTLSILGVL
ncbi:MAG TPA: AEC family transporter [Pseudobdellovibrionaceae bacterium]|nr:AEC family transporter [Pseudobdellovibrionaceae bacterium]